MIASRRNVLLFHQAAFGDFVLTWPIALAASRLWPTNRTIYVTQPGKGALAERAIGVEWRDGDAWHALFEPNVDASKLPHAATKSLAGTTLIISFISTGDDAWSENVRRLAPDAQLVCVKPRPDQPIDRHLTLFHAEQFHERPDLQAAIGQMVRHVSANAAVPRRGSGEAIVIHPGSGGSHKRWPADRFAALAAALASAGHDVVAVLGEVERERWSPAERAAIDDAAQVVSPATLVDLLAVVQSARLYVGNDSGPTHLAAMAGVPTIALFGQDNDVTWRPLGPSVRVVKQVPLDTLEVDAVIATATDLLGVMPEAVPANVGDD